MSQVKFSVSCSQDSGGVGSPKCQRTSSRVLGFKVPVPGSWVSGSRVSGSQSPRVFGPGSQGLKSWVSGFQSPRVQGLRILGPGSQGFELWVSGPRFYVSGPDFRLCLNPGSHSPGFLVPPWISGSLVLGLRS